MVHNPVRITSNERSGWTHILVTILSPAQVNPSPDEGGDVRNFNLHHTNYPTTNGRAKAKAEIDRIDWNGSPHVHPLARRNTNPRSAQRHHSGAIWRHILSRAVYKDLKAEEEEKKSGVTTSVKSRDKRGSGGEEALSRMEWDGLDCGTCRFQGVCEVHRQSNNNKNNKPTLGVVEDDCSLLDIQHWRRFVRLECMGLSGVLFYELARPVLQSGDCEPVNTTHPPSQAPHRIHGQHQPLLTLESVFGDLDDPTSPSMHVDDLLDAVKAKVCYFPTYACTSFIAGQAMLAFYRDQPELRPIPCADGFCVRYPPSISPRKPKTAKVSAGQSKSASSSWKDGSETAPFLGDSRMGSASMNLDLDEEDPYRMLLIRSCSHPIVGRSGVDMAMAYGNTGSVSMEELENVKEKVDAKRDSGYGSITGILRDSDAFEADIPVVEGIDDLTILPLTPSDIGTPRDKGPRMKITTPSNRNKGSSNHKKALRLLPTRASLTNMTNVTSAGAADTGYLKMSVSTSLSKPFGIAVSMPAISTVMSSVSSASHMSMYDTFTSFLDFLEPDDGEGAEMDVGKGLTMA